MEAGASSSSVEGGPGAGEGEEEEGEDVGTPALGPQDLQSFFEMNAGDWRGHFLVSEDVRGERGVSE